MKYMLVAIACFIMYLANGNTNGIYACKFSDVGGFLADHTLFDAVLKRYVSKDGKVYYKSLKKNKKSLDKYLKNIESHPPHKSWTRQDSMAYWINAYNAYTLKMIIDNYPLKSILDLHDGKPWSLKWIKIGNKNYSLDNIEHDILRPQFKDARVHFAVNCASFSCPPLLDRAFKANELNKMLTDCTTQFINSGSNQITTTTIKLSKILDWYKADFGDIYAFLATYSVVKPIPKVSITYLEYDWSLNEVGK